MFKNLINKINVRLVWIWLFTYISVFCLPFIVCAYNYYQTYTIIKNEIEQNNLMLLEQVQVVIDNYIEDL